MSDDDTQTLTIDGQVHTYMTNAFRERGGERDRGVCRERRPRQAKAGSQLHRAHTRFPENTREARRKQREVITSAFATSGW